MESPKSRPVKNPVFGEPVFGEKKTLPNPPGFSTPHPSDSETYAEVESLLTKDVVPIPPSRAKPDELYSLQQALGARGADTIKAIVAAKRIVFHALGDSGASQASRFTAELSVTQQLAADVHSSEPDAAPSFLFHLGDVVYDFGEEMYWYDQFYDAFRNYPAPIFAIPGNHDSFVIPGTPAGETPLDVFQRNFCATAPAVTPEARSLHRTAMTQPGVYFCLDAPFVRIVGLFSNALEDPGVVSQEGTDWPTLSGIQLEFLEAQLHRAQSEKYAGALLLAVHHTPFSYTPPKGGHGSGGHHGSSTAMLRDIDQIAKKVGIYPHAFLSGHAHNYQRYTRTVSGFGSAAYDVPFIVCGNGGHNHNKLVQSHGGKQVTAPEYGSDVKYMDVKPAVEASGLLLEKYDDEHFGYLRISVDAKQLRIGYHQSPSTSLLQSRYDLVTLDIDSHTMVSN